MCNVTFGIWKVPSKAQLFERLFVSLQMTEIVLIRSRLLVCRWKTSFCSGWRRMGRCSVMLLTCTSGCKLAFWLIAATYVLHYGSVCLIGDRGGWGGGTETVGVGVGEALNFLTLQEEKDLLVPRWKLPLNCNNIRVFEICCHNSGVFHTSFCRQCPLPTPARHRQIIGMLNFDNVREQRYLAQK